MAGFVQSEKESGDKSPVTYPNGDFAERLAVLAAMLHTGMPIKCASLNAVGSYDTHSDAANTLSTNLEETVYRNNLEAAEEVARQLRLRDIGGIIVIDFIDMEIRENRDKVGSALRSALARDNTRTQVFDISELGLVEMTRKRVSEGLIESMSTTCEVCGGRGIVFDDPEL